jgi:hypothetical protein
LGLDLTYWAEDPDFAIDNHVHGHVLASPGDDRALAAYVGEIMGAPLDLSRPPWAIHVIEGLSGGRVAVATQIHHSASDGMAAAELFAILQIRPRNRATSAQRRRINPSVFRRGQRCSRAASQAFRASRCGSFGASPARSRTR